jgi:hypothetical protein
VKGGGGEQITVPKTKAGQDRVRDALALLGRPLQGLSSTTLQRYIRRSATYGKLTR